MKMLKHEKGVWIPRADAPNASQLYRALKKFMMTYDKFSGGSGLHPECDRIEDLAPHLKKVWQIVVEMDNHAVETKDVTAAATEKWANSNRKARV